MTNSKNKNSIYGLVLAGGKSKRLGKDKGKIKWHGKQQRYYLVDLLNKYCNETYISCRTDQKNEISSSYKTITDSFENLGSYGALLSALTKYPEHSFLVVACDMPHIDENAIEQLIDKRDEKKLATAYKNFDDDLPEPLLAIWEPESRIRLLQLLKEGITCPRKALIKSKPDVKLIKPASPEISMNINTPEDEKQVRILLN